MSVFPFTLTLLNQQMLLFFTTLCWLLRSDWACPTSWTLIGLVTQVNRCVLTQHIILISRFYFFYLLQTLDTRDLKIVSVTANGQEAQFTMGPKHSFKGTPLEVMLPFDLSRWTFVLSPHVSSKLNAANELVFWTNQRAASYCGGGLWDISTGDSSAVAHTRADCWEETSVPV